ncbi:MAG: GNAT family N-acetyltransferase [Candidatus Thorarchaeota archaeon]
MQIVEFNRDVHESDLYRLNVEYVTWVADIFRTALNLDFGKVLGDTIQGYVSSFLKDFVKIKPPSGIILLVEDQGKMIGMGAVHEFVHGVGEITRMFLQSPYRGRGLGTDILNRLISKGREFGFKKLRLDTSEHFPYAIQLYQSAGFIEVPLDNLGEAQPETQHTQMELLL